MQASLDTAEIYYEVKNQKSSLLRVTFPPTTPPPSPPLPSFLFFQKNKNKNCGVSSF